MKAEMGAEAFQMNVKIKKYITLRQLMQEKLKQVKPILTKNIMII